MVNDLDLKQELLYQISIRYEPDDQFPLVLLPQPDNWEVFCPVETQRDVEYEYPEGDELPVLKLPYAL